MKRFLLEKPLVKGDPALEIWVCDNHYTHFLSSNRFQQLTKEYDCIIILEGIVQGIPQVCWCCSQNDGDATPFLTYHGDDPSCFML